MPTCNHRSMPARTSERSRSPALGPASSKLSSRAAS
jgi:hypothetical protein